MLFLFYVVNKFYHHYIFLVYSFNINWVGAAFAGIPSFALFIRMLGGMYMHANEIGLRNRCCCIIFTKISFLVSTLVSFKNSNYDKGSVDPIKAWPSWKLPYRPFDYMSKWMAIIFCFQCFQLHFSHKLNPLIYCELEITGRLVEITRNCCWWIAFWRCKGCILACNP